MFDLVALGPARRRFGFLLEGVSTWGRLVDRSLEALFPQSPVAVVKPVFVLGLERSGTTLVYSLLAHHPRFYWLSRLDTLFPQSPLATSAVRRFLEETGPARSHLSLPGTISRYEGLVAPSECLPFWSLHMPNPGVIRDDGVLIDTDVSGPSAERLRADLGVRLHIAAKGGFLAKRPGFTLKISYLHAVFPDAIFVDVVRRAEDNIRSLMIAKERSQEVFWGTRVPGWRELVTRSLRFQAEAQLAAVRDTVANATNHLPAGQYVQADYDEIVDSPASAVDSLLKAIGLPASSEVAAAAEKVRRLR